MIISLSFHTEFAFNLIPNLSYISDIVKCEHDLLTSLVPALAQGECAAAHRQDNRKFHQIQYFEKIALRLVKVL